MEFGLQLQVVLVFPQGNRLLEFTVTTLFQRINVSLEINVHFATALEQQEPGGLRDPGLGEVGTSHLPLPRQ